MGHQKAICRIPGQANWRNNTGALKCKPSILPPNLKHGFKTKREGTNLIPLFGASFDIFPNKTML